MYFMNATWAHVASVTVVTGCYVLSVDARGRVHRSASNLEKKNASRCASR